MKIVVTIAALNLQHGGPARTVPALCRALAAKGANVELVTITEGGEIDESCMSESVRLTAVPTEADRYHPLQWRPSYDAAVRNALASERDTILYDVGLWLPANHYSASVARQMRTPFVISPRGMLSARALRSARWKKRFAWHLYQKRDVRVARALHATSAAEAADLRAVGLNQPTAVIPNGVAVRPDRGPVQPRDGLRTALFLSRIDPVKGLLDLVEAWACVRPVNWRVVVVGPDERGHAAEVQRRVSELGVSDAVTFQGPASDEQKWQWLAEAELFILPSHSESFGLAIAEALAAGVPVITTRATPWAEIEQYQCGWWVEPGVAELVRALRDATAQPAPALLEMGKRGADLIRRKYSWDAAAGRMVDFFRSVLDTARATE